MLKTGDQIPAFELASDSAGTVSNSALKGRRYVLYFYPRDDTPGCTREACAFRDNLPAFGDLGAPVFGVSADDTESHVKFADKFSLNFPLLADPERKLIDPLGLWGEKSFMGRSYMGVLRTTFIVDANGRIEKIWEDVKPVGHAEEVLAYLREAPATPPPVESAAPPARKPAAKAKPAAKKPAAKAKPAAKKPTAKAKPAAKAGTASKKTAR